MSSSYERFSAERVTTQSLARVAPSARLAQPPPRTAVLVRSPDRLFTRKRVTALIAESTVLALVITFKATKIRRVGGVSLPQPISAVCQGDRPPVRRRARRRPTGAPGHRRSRPGNQGTSPRAGRSRSCCGRSTNPVPSKRTSSEVVSEGRSLQTATLRGALSRGMSRVPRLRSASRTAP
jgi:hypothetical protein